jgi:triosephosphate isomerase
MLACAQSAPGADERPRTRIETTARALRGGMTDALVWIGTSWKMNKTLGEARAFAKALVTADAAGDRRIQRFVIPPFTAVREVKSLLADTSVKVGAQNMHWADDGAWTGEISPPMLTDCPLEIVELGHSERANTSARATKPWDWEPKSPCGMD